MTKPELLFDANAIYRLIRELPDDAIEKLVEGSTIYLAYYEIGNAIWRECLLLKRISKEDAEKSLNFIYTLLDQMHIASLDNDSATAILNTACKFNLTFYDSAYLTEAKKSNKTLVTDDKKLAKAAEKLRLKTLPSITSSQEST
jgi:predicted nucleic acid-binding protein